MALGVCSIEGCESGGAWAHGSGGVQLRGVRELSSGDAGVWLQGVQLRGVRL